MNLFEGRTVASVVHEFGTIRGDLVTSEAQDQLVRFIEQRLEQRETDVREDVASRLENVVAIHSDRKETKETRAIVSAMVALPDLIRKHRLQS